MTTTEGFPAHTGSPSPFRHLAGTVLVVDDDEGVLEAMRRTLRHSAFRLITCSCGAAAFEVACREAVDVVVCDLLMPAMDGLEVLDRIHERRPEAIRILMTGQPSAGSAIDAINHGEVFRYLTKPLSRDLLEATLTMAFGRLAETRARAAQAAGSQATPRRQAVRQGAVLTDAEREALHRANRDRPWAPPGTLPPRRN